MPRRNGLRNQDTNEVVLFYNHLLYIRSFFLCLNQLLLFYYLFESCSQFRYDERLSLCERDHLIMPGSETAESEPAVAIRLRREQRRLVIEARHGIRNGPRSVPVLREIAAGSAIPAHRKKSDRRVLLLLDHRGRHAHASRNGKRIDGRARGEHDLERFRNGVPVQILETAPDRERISRIRIQL